MNGSPKKLLFFCSLGIFSLFYLYNKSEHDLYKTHNKLVLLLQQIEHVNTALEKDVLRSRSHLLPSYDGIVDKVAFLDTSCELLQGHQIITPTLKLTQAVENYCSYIRKKLDLVEEFKSKNSIIRNSIIYISKQGANLSIQQSEKPLLNLVSTSYAYYFTPTAETQIALRIALDQTQKVRMLTSSHQWRPLLEHSKSVLERSAEVDELVGSIVDSEQNHEIDHLSTVYMSEYAQAAQKADRYRLFLFILGISLLLFVAYQMRKIWKIASALVDANANLEKRVTDRTQQLQESLQLISNQQQTLVQQSKMSALGEMAGGIAHEINSPLATIRLNIDMIERHLKKDEVKREYLEKCTTVVSKTIQRIATTVHGLRGFSRDGSDDLLEKVKAQDLITETLFFCQEKIKKNGVDLQLPEISENIVINCRSVEISQVLLNLLNNSYDAICDSENAWIRIECRQSDSTVEISVTDSGKGISPDLQQKIFQPFFTTKEVGKGTGLGLSISMGIMKSHHGTLTYDNTSPNTKFVIALPIDIPLEVSRVS